MAEIRRIVARWPREAIRSGRDDGGELVVTAVKRASPEREAIATIRRALLSVADRGGPWSMVRRIEMSERPLVQPYFSGSDRRATVLEALGQPVMLWSDSIRDRNPSFTSRARIYLDVSGSMNISLPLIYSALIPLREWIHPVVHVFSTEVVDISFSRLARFEAPSTGGTAIACVTGHIIDHEVRRAVILTDGLVGSVPGPHVPHLRRLRAAVVLSEPYADNGFTRDLRARIFRLPNLETR